MQKIVMFTDPNKDVDDLITIIMLNNMQKAGIAEIAGIVTTHGNAETTYKRAVYTQGVSKVLGNNIEVCAGLEEVYDNERDNKKVNRFFDANGLDEIMQNCDKTKIKTDSEKYLKNIFDNAEPKSLDMLVIAQMTDIWNFAEKHPTLFNEKVKTVNIMGMFEKVDGGGRKLCPDNSTNNANDYNASNNLYQFLQDHNIPTMFINRFGVMQVPVDMAFYQSFRNDNKLIGDFVFDAEQKSIKGLYYGLINGEALARQTPEWFYQTFTNLDESEYERFKLAGADPETVDELMKRVSKLNLYDPLTLIASIDEFKHFFNRESNGSFEVLMPENKEAIYKAFNRWTKGSESSSVLTTEKAEELVKNGYKDKIMPEFKIKHSFSVAETAQKIAEKCGLDGQKAYVLGLIHDIGSHFGFDQHPYNGYKYIKSLGYDDEYADICLTHSFLHGDPNCTADGMLTKENEVVENNIIPWENKEDTDFVLNFLNTHDYTEYEDIINLCDLMCTDKVIGLDTRLIDLIARKGAFITTQNHIKTAKKLQADIEKAMGCSMLDLFPEMIENQKAGDTYLPNTPKEQPKQTKQ